jgi:hypothetical protein
MSRGFGRAERFILRELERLRPGSVLLLPWLAQAYEREYGLRSYRAALEGLRRAINTLVRDGETTVGYEDPRLQGPGRRAVLVVPSPEEALERGRAWGSASARLGIVGFAGPSGLPKETPLPLGGRPSRS